MRARTLGPHVLLALVGACQGGQPAQEGRLEGWDCVAQAAVDVAPDEVVAGRVTPAEVAALVGGTFTGTVAWQTRGPEVEPDFAVVSSVEGTSATVTVSLEPDPDSARFVDYEYTLVMEGELTPEIDVACGSELVLDAVVELGSDDGALAESRIATVRVALPPEEEPDAPWSPVATVEDSMGADASWEGTLAFWTEGGTGSLALDGQGWRVEIAEPGDLAGSVWVDFVEVRGAGATVWNFELGAFEATRAAPPPG